MSLPYAKPQWVDAPASGVGSYRVAMPVGLPEFSSPIDATTKEYVLRQSFQQYKNDWAATAQGTAHPDYPTFYLVSEGERKDKLGGVVEWERIYAAVPDTFSEWETFAYAFIGNFGVSGINVSVVPGRPRTVFSVSTRVQNDFFLVPSSVVDPILGGAAVSITTPGSIPKIWAFQYAWQTEYLGVLYGGLFFPTDQLALAAATTPTVPTLEQYREMIAEALADGWASTVSVQKFFNDGAIDVNNSIFGGQIAVEDSRLSRWMGPVWLRQTRYALAR